VNKEAFLVFTLGCKLNQLESEAVIDAFLQAGFKSFNEEPDFQPAFVVVNTCTVTGKADQKARGVIRKALRDFPDSKVIVTGCYAQLNKDELFNLNPDRILVISKDNILDYINNLNEKNPASRGGGEVRGQFEFNPSRFSAHTRSFLKIQDGCDNKCTYCKIRLARGASVSLEAKQVLERLRILENEHAEAVLTGVNISQYKDDIGTVSELLDYLLAGTSKIALRLSSLAPDCIDEKLAKVLSNKRIRPHFHLSIQSGSEKVLENMGRNYNAQTIEKAAALLRAAKDNPFLACDIIAGFPGETEAEFEKNYSLCKKLKFAWIHVFPYSKRPGTPAFSFTDTVHSGEITKRVQLLTDLAKSGRAEYIQSYLGREVDVIIEGKRGITENYLKVLVHGKERLKAGTVLRCRLEAAGEPDKCDVAAFCLAP